MAVLSAQVLSHHFLRRRARHVAANWNVEHDTTDYYATVVKAVRGPYRYRTEVRRRRRPLD